jgi:hypothetical protein
VRDSEFSWRNGFLFFLYIKKGTTVLGTAPLSGGMATFGTSTLPSGSNSITASYGATTNYLTSSSVALIEVVQ